MGFNSGFKGLSKINLALKPYDTAQEARMNFMNWYLHGKDTGEMDYTIFPCKQTSWFNFMNMCTLRINGTVLQKTPH